MKYTNVDVKELNLVKLELIIENILERLEDLEKNEETK